MSEVDTPIARDDRIGCEEAIERLAEYLDRELDASRSQEVEKHLETCRACYSRAEFERRLRARLERELRTSQVPPEFEQRIRALIR